MASALVDLVVGKLGGMVAEQINKEASLVLNFRKDFEWLSKKLTSIRRYLREADLQRAHNEGVKSWLLDVAEIAWDAEDIVDECAVESQGTNNETLHSSCVCAFSYSQLVFRYKMARRIKDVKDRMRSIMKDAVELKLVQDLTQAHSDQPSTSTSQNVKWRERSSLIESASRPVAIHSKVQQVLRLVDDPASPVIAVVGMGGVGKTFLLQHVFNTIKDKKDKFENSIWLSISQTYSIQKLQADLASEINLNEVVNGKVSEVQAAKLIHDSLAIKRCLIVLDDVWNWRAPGEVDLISALGLPTGKCKIVVTTRSRDVCSDMNARVYELQTLSGEESWELFCAFAFPDCQPNKPPHQLEGIARQIEAECWRLPLAVKTVAASLKGKRLSSEWKSKLRHLKEASSTDDPIMQILLLSYVSLPAHLKPCFAFLSFFPEDQEINSRYLINLWVAEGYIPQGEDQLDIGWDYICQLHSLCLLETGRDIYDDTFQHWVKLYTRYKLHELMLDLAIRISKESKCAFSVEEAFKKGQPRILMGNKSIGNGDVDKMASNRAYSASRLRTLSFSRNTGIQNIPAKLLSGARVLRILDLSHTNISSLPVCVENLRLLRVLNLRGTNITEVPECVRSNKSLRFLDISKCNGLKQLPNWIGELKCLEHLDMRGSINKLMPKGISELVSLQVLRSDGCKLCIEDNEFLKLDHFVNLTNLREVRIDIHHEAKLKSIEDGILAMLVKMRNLRIKNKVDVRVCNLPLLSEKMLAMKDLEFLSLYSFAMPNWICGFSNLMKLYLSGCRCAEYPALEMMPNLIELELFVNDICKALPKGFGKSGGFPQLRYFRIAYFFALEELSEFKDGAMPHLENLSVQDCRNLKKAPAGLELLKSLKECRFRSTGVTDMFMEGGEFWNKMKANNANVSINDW